MRIGLCIYGSLDTLSGGYLYDRQLVRQLQAAGHRVEIITVPWRRYTRHLTDNWSIPLRRRLQQAQLDLLLQDELNHPSLAWLNGWLRRHVTYPMITIVHHLRCSEQHSRVLLPFYRWVERQYLQQVDGFLYNSQTTRTTVQTVAPHTKPELIAYPAADHRQPPDGSVVTAKLTARARTAAPLQLLFVGNVIERKGLHHLLAALAELPKQEWRLHVAGSLDTAPVYVKEIQRQLTQMGLSDNVQLHGVVNDEQLRQLYHESDLFAAPAYEGFGIAYLEAMSFGLPVIASTAGAAHELVTPGVTGFLVTPGNREQLSGYLTQSLHDRRLVATMGEAARTRYTTHPTWAASFAPVLPWLEEFKNRK